MDQFGQLKDRLWKQFPELKIFEEGYNKDYIYEERKNILILNEDYVNSKSSIGVELQLNNSSKRGFVGGKSQILLTMRGAIKFNMWKRTEGGKMIASALIEMDYKMILQIQEERIL